MKRNKKGFTLIELLAVIVILAIIALIAVPVIMNIINKANKSAFKDTAYGVISAGELYFAEQQLELNGMSNDAEFVWPDQLGTLQVKGNVPYGTVLQVNTKGETALAMSNGRYCVTKGYNDKDITITEDYEECNIPDAVEAVKTLADLAVISAELGVNSIAECATNGTKCADLTAFAIEVNDTETYKFYVLNDTGTEVTLIMNKNLTMRSWGNTTSSGPKAALSMLKIATSGWTNIALYSYTLENDADFNGGNYEDLYPDILMENVRARLPKYSDICKFENPSTFVLPSELYENYDSSTGGYWLSTADTSQDGRALSVVSSLKMVGVTGIASTIGIRPVITLTK